MAAEVRLKCPVCGAAFRGPAVCSRCGADLAALMQLVLSSVRLRNAARAAAYSGDYVRAAQLVETAQARWPTLEGRGLRVLVQWLAGLR
jgi:hypothetical protein